MPHTHKGEVGNSSVQGRRAPDEDSDAIIRRAAAEE